jgi:peptide chain release factor subunit 3
MKKNEFPELGGSEENKLQKPKENGKAVSPAKGEEGKAAKSTAGSKLKLGNRSFAARSFKPKTPAKINHYVSHVEPSITEQEYFPTLGGEVAPPKKEIETEAIQKHAEFMERHDLFKPYICLYDKTLWFVPDEAIDQFGYPNMTMLPDLYMYLWNTYNMFFNTDGQWATNAATIMSTLGELWQHAEWRDKIIEKEQREFEAWEEQMREWEDDQEEEEGFNLEDDRFPSGKNKNKNKNKKKKTGKKPPPMPSRNKESYARFKKDKDETAVVKPKSQFKEVNEITFDEEMTTVDETRDPSSLVFIGHVDVGKSTICGNLMFMTGMVDQRTIDKFKQEAREKNRDSWWLAYVMDINDDEKAKGKTVEVGRATLETKTKRYTVFDAPGHKNYVPDMIMGAAMADVAALVISARKGEYESGFEGEGQTREHAQLARSLGVEKLVVIVNKMDEESVGWAKSRYDEIVEGVTPFLEGECGYKKENIVFIPISGLSGENIDRVGGKCDWYDGPCLIDVLDNVATPKRNANASIRIPVLDKMKDRALIAFGKIESGTVEIGSKLTVMPNDIKCQVTGIYNCKQQLVSYAKPGENIQVKVRMIDDENMINKGDVLCPFDDPAPLTELFVAEMTILSNKKIITPGYKAMMHMHTIADEAIIKTIDGVYEIDGNGKEYLRPKPKYVKSGSRIIAKISTRVPVCLEKYEDVPQMGQFTLRDEGKTIALGKVLKYKPAERRADGDDKERLIQRIEQAQKEKAEKLNDQRDGNNEDAKTAE